MCKEDVEKIFKEISEKNYQSSPNEPNYSRYMASVAFCDSNMFPSEMDFLFETGEKILGLPGAKRHKSWP